MKNLNSIRGVQAALSLGLLGGLAPGAILLTLTLLRWLMTGADEFDRRFDLYWLKTMLIFPMIGCAIIFACAGWATFGPVGRFRFAQSLALVTGMSVALWFVIGPFVMTPHRFKGVERPPIYGSEFLFLTIPLVALSAIITLVRVHLASKPASPPD